MYVFFHEKDSQEAKVDEDQTILKKNERFIWLETDCWRQRSNTSGRTSHVASWKQLLASKQMHLAKEETTTKWHKKYSLIARPMP